MHKGCDQAMFTLQSSQVDEILDYQNARYVSSNEAAWTILEFPIHERDPPVQQLVVHLENSQCVYFTEDTAWDQASDDPQKTTLTEFFTLCQVDNFAKTLLYKDVPKYYGATSLGAEESKAQMWQAFQVSRRHIVLVGFTPSIPVRENASTFGCFCIISEDHSLLLS